MDFSQITNHPDCDEIISKLITGTIPKDVHQWLKIKYSAPEQKHLILTIKLLEQFSKSQYTSLYKQFSDDSKKIKSGEKIDRKLLSTVYDNKTYQERMNEWADSEIDIKRIYQETIMMMRARVMQLFDLIQENPGNYRPDYAAIGWVKEMMMTLKDFDIREKAPQDQVVKHHHTVQYVDQNVALIQDAIRDVLMEMEPEFAARFLEKLSQKMEGLKPVEEPKVKILSQEARMEAALALQASVEGK